MSDVIAPVEPVVIITPQPVPTPPAATPPEGYIEQARYNGLVRKVEELTLGNRDLVAQLAVKASEAEQLKGQLAIKDVEKTVAVGEQTGALQTALQAKATLETEVAELRGLKLKVEVIKELGRPELMKIVDRIPAMTDKEALKAVMLDFAGFADELVSARERQLLSGVTPPLTPGITPATPGSYKAWEDHVNKLPLGSAERAAALINMGAWLTANNK